MIANLLVGNEANAAGLEITLGQVEIEFARSGWFALTGAACEATLDGKAVWVGWRTAYRPGQRLVLKTPQHGIRSYLAVAGGIAVPEVLGSRCTDLKAGIGGLEGRRLQDGDKLKLGKAARRFTTPRGVKQLPLATAFVRCPGRSTTNLTRPRRRHSGAPPGSSVRRVTAWGTACRGSR